MRSQWILTFAAITTLGGLGFVQTQTHFNPVIDLVSQKKPVFGLYAPSNPRGRRGAPPPPEAPAPKTPLELAKDAVAYQAADYIFDGTMEGDFDRAYQPFADFVKGMSEAGVLTKSPSLRMHHPLFVKMHEIAPDSNLAKQHIAKQLNLGVAGVVLVGVESPEEVKTGIAAMRFKSKGGTRPDDVGGAPAYWGMSEKDYKEKADVWPLNPRGELMNWTIVESKEGIKNIRQIAAVKGIGVLFPGAGTLRGVYSTTDSAGRRVLDEAAWENAIQSVLSACKEFNIACGYPATANDVEMRMKQGFSVFVINWGEPGFKTIDIGRKVGGR